MSIAMSYDYSLFLAPGPGPMSSWPADAPESLGTFDHVKERLAEVLPDTSWQTLRETFFGRSEVGVEFQITPDADGSCRFVTARRITRAQLETLCRALGVVAVDNQTVEVIRPGE